MAKLLKEFYKNSKKNKARYKRFLTGIENNPPRRIHDKIALADAEAWTQVDCLECANCCKTMTPTWLPADIKRVATYLNLSPKDFKEKWLVKDKSGDWVNKSTPCQFLNLKNNKCSVYPYRPKDCSGFPHHRKKPVNHYIHVFKQNLEYCPATYKMVENLKEKMLS